MREGRMVAVGMRGALTIDCTRFLELVVEETIKEGESVYVRDARSLPDLRAR